MYDINKKLKELHKKINKVSKNKQLIEFEIKNIEKILNKLKVYEK